jgi:hypothetical protein
MCAVYVRDPSDRPKVPPSADGSVSMQPAVTSHLLADARWQDGPVRLARFDDLRNRGLPGHDESPERRTPHVAMAGLLLELHWLHLVRRVSVRLPGRAIRAALDAVGGSCLDLLAVAPVLVPGIQLFRFEQSAQRARGRRVDGRPGDPHLLAGLPLQARLERRAAAADQMGRPRHLPGGGGVSGNGDDAFGIRPGTHVAGQAGRASDRILSHLPRHVSHTLKHWRDGCGLPDPRESSQARTGVGLSSMRERASELGGSLTVESHPGGGTLVRARLPLPEEE